MKLTVLILCAGNCCRSQLAEGIRASMKSTEEPVGPERLQQLFQTATIQ